MSEKLLDLDKIPEHLPFKNYRNWLLWKVNQMQVGDRFNLPIFSSFEVLRMKTCVIVINNFTDKMYATGVDAAVNLVEAIETQNFTVTNPNLKSAILMVRAERMKEQGYTQQHIARVLKCSRNKVLYYLATAS